MSCELRRLHNSWCRDTGIDKDNEQQINRAATLARVLIDSGEDPSLIETQLTRLGVPPWIVARVS